MPVAVATEAAWYALRTRSRHEKVVRDQLATPGIEPFLPLVTRWRRWADRRKRVAFLSSAFRTSEGTVSRR